MELLIAQVLGCLHMRTREYAVALGIAVQLTDALRDVHREVSRGGVHPPREDLERFEVDPAIPPEASSGRTAGWRAVASRGIRGATDAQRTIAPGADAASPGLPLLRSCVEGGRAPMPLTGARQISEVDRAPRVLGPRLRA